VSAEALMCSPFFTVFTPTYNRARTLPALYAALVQQTFKSFEWLIVDDGSEDETAELVKLWQSEGRVRVRYSRQSNSGKHVAHNRAVREASGQLFLVLDSDDTCVPNALERLRYHWESIPANERTQYSGVTCLCMDAAGHIVGTPFPNGVARASPALIAGKYGVKGEKWGFHRTDVLRQFPFPEFEGERFVPEGLVWNRIAREYKLKLVNEALRIYEPRAGGLSATAVRLRAASPQAVCLYYQEYVDLAASEWERMRAAVNYRRFWLHARAAATRVPRASFRPIPGLVAWPIAWCAYLADRHRLRRPTVIPP
jgi:glycosyltransferase involved in cell wall biosynthesis